MKKRFTKKQLEIMKILWNSDKPLIASDIVKQNETLNINTVQACLRSLVANKSIEVTDIVYSGTVLTRRYAPLISKEEYLDNTYKDILGKGQTFSLIASLIDSETSLSELEELEKIIAQKKQDIERGGEK
ncbi:BlaI/MecI/CopY family transcriptional regulator [Bariatricus sp. SGI.154]|uniref:BlaI/MecI/CopY family transcriptional regulator n=1 Tax=Bariatricus sp. SGI.154 TaxID=3420549 RepID=UPI003CFDCC6E